MVSTATINEPFLLSSYSVAPRLSGSKLKHQSKQAGIYASYQKPSSSSDGFVSVAAQYDGVHVVDVSTLHPIISHTLGPSTTFACAPLTKYHPSKSIYTTFSVIASSPNLDVDHQGKTIWKWSDNLSSQPNQRSSSTSGTPYQSVVVPHVISGLYDCEALPSRIFAISPNGHVSLLTTDLELKATCVAPGEERNVISVQVLPRSSCSFLRSKLEGAAIVLVTRRASSLQVEVYCVGTEDSIDSSLVHELPLESQETATTSCSSSGTLNIILKTGIWHSFSLTPSSIASVSSPVKLTGLSFIPPAPTKQSLKTPASPVQVSAPSLLALTSSHVLLASQTLQNEIALLLWDSQYFVLLASYLLPLQSSLTSQTSPLSLSLIPPSSGVKAGNQQAVLVLSQSASDIDGKTPVKSRVYAVPYSIPARSTLANAIGCGNSGEKWLETCKLTEKGVSLQDAAREKVVVNMRTAVEQNRPQAANTLFKEWETKEEEKMKDRPGNAVMFGYSFVKGLLDAVIQPQKPPSPLYSSEVVRHLIVKGAVRSAMLDDGLLACLRLRNDWKSIDLALQHVPDLSENELIGTLNAVVGHTLTLDSNTMQVDPTSSTLDQTPPISDILKAMLKHRQFTTTQLITALRRHLCSAEAITSILEVLDGWIQKVQSREVKLLPSKKDVKKNESGVFILKEDKMKSKLTHDLPTMNQILDFLQPLLDASFLILLQHSPAQKILQSLKENIDLETAALSQMERVRGLVDVFARAHEKALQDAEERKATKDGAAGGKENSKQDWRQRKKGAHEQAGMAIGVYSLEELVL